MTIVIARFSVSHYTLQLSTSIRPVYGIYSSILNEARYKHRETGFPWDLGQWVLVNSPQIAPTTLFFEVRTTGSCWVVFRAPGSIVKFRVDLELGGSRVLVRQRTRTFWEIRPKRPLRFHGNDYRHCSIISIPLHTTLQLSTSFRPVYGIFLDPKWSSE